MRPHGFPDNGIELYHGTHGNFHRRRRRRNKIKHHPSKINHSIALYNKANISHLIINTYNINDWQIL